jgi:excisionase family DNA binding protein
MSLKSNRLTMSITDAARKLGVGRNTAYEAARAGEIPTIRIGKKILVPLAAFENYLAQTHKLKEAAVDNQAIADKQIALLQKPKLIEIGLRLPEPLRNRVKRIATLRGISISSAIVTLLELALAKEEQSDE